MSRHWRLVSDTPLSHVTQHLIHLQKVSNWNPFMYIWHDQSHCRTHCRGQCLKKFRWWGSGLIGRSHKPLYPIETKVNVKPNVTNFLTLTTSFLSLDSYKEQFHANHVLERLCDLWHLEEPTGTGRLRTSLRVATERMVGSQVSKRLLLLF